MLYLIGLGLNERGVSLEGKEAIKKCKKIYLEFYTVDFPYSICRLEKIIGREIIKLSRGDVENDGLIKEAKKQNIAVLIYGCPVFATTHIGLLMECEKAKIKSKIIYSASVFDAIGETGLQLYKFGKISSMPKWQKNFTPDSFLEFVEENESIGAHSLILIDIGLSFEEALMQLNTSCKKRNFDINSLLVCSCLGTSKTNNYFGTLEILKKKKIPAPFCFIIPGKMHFMEKEGVERFLK